MKVVMTPGARADLEDILSFLSSNYPGAIAAFERRLKLTLRRIERWPKSAAVVANRNAIHMAPLFRYPYKIFIGSHTTLKFRISTLRRGGGAGSHKPRGGFAEDKSAG